MRKILNVMIAFIVLIVIWQSVIWIGGYEEALLPSPLSVASGIVEMVITGTIFEHIGISLYRFFMGYGSAVIVAIVLGLILGRSPKLWGVVDPIVQVLRPVAPVAWTPFIVLWFGIGNMPAIVIIFIAAFFSRCCSQPFQQ